MTYLWKYVFAVKQKEVNLKIFSMITGIYEAKTLVKHICFCCKCRSIVQYIIQIKTGIMKHVNMSVKNDIRTKNIIIQILAQVFVRMIII